LRVAILGGGISGLSAAWYLLKKEPKAQIDLFEASTRLGGWIESKIENQFLFELGPRTFQTARCPELLQMIQELGLEVVYSDKKSQSKFLCRRGQLRSIGSFWPQILRAALQDLFAPRSKAEDESIYDFACRRMGRNAAELFFDPIAKGVYGGDIRKLSTRASFPFLFEAEKRERSLVKWMFKQKRKDPSLFTLRDGMESLIKALQKLPLKIHLETPVEEIREGGIIAKAKFWPAELIVSALPGLEIASLTKIPLALRNEPISVVNFGFHGKILPEKGYGYLVPSAEGENILGQIWDTSLFPVPGQTKVTSMTRGADPVGIALMALKKHLNISAPPAAIAFKEAQIPQYDLGHLCRIKTFENTVLSRFQGKLKLAGNYLFGASVEGCLHRAKSLFK
jgi:oxygen-dependent protoporphyrinogen oxidase